MPPNTEHWRAVGGKGRGETGGGRQCGENRRSQLAQAGSSESPGCGDDHMDSDVIQLHSRLADENWREIWRLLDMLYDNDVGGRQS